MRRAVLARAALALSLLATSTSCAESPAGAGRLTGLIAAGVEIPDLPAECRDHVALTREIARVGDDAFTLLRKADQRIREGNSKTDRCAGFFDDMKARMGKAPSAPALPKM